jgi:alcohol dehydrogenase
MTFGHEFIGVVEEVGPSVQNLKRGDRVMVPFNVFCGSCFFCARGLYANCHNVNPTPPRSAASTATRTPAAATTAARPSSCASLRRRGPEPDPGLDGRRGRRALTDALATGYFGRQLGDIVEGDVVVVFGAGRWGLFAPSRRG